MEKQGSKRAAGLRSFLANVGESLVDSVSHAFHPLVGQYAKLFKEGARTPVLRRPSDYGMAFEDCFFPSADGVASRRGSFPRIPTGC